MSASANLVVSLKQEKPVSLDVDLHCEAGELVAMVGPSGSGKTTILRCIAGLHQADMSKVVVGGNTWWDSGVGINLPIHERCLGIVFQAYGLFPHMSVAENLQSAMLSEPQSDQHDKIQELLSLVNLTGLEGRRPSQLSGGQQQRVAVARALARNPGILLLDEPFSAVDLMTRKKLRRELAKIRRPLNIPILLVTHDLEEAEELADRICIVHHGETLQADAPRVILNKPRSEAVARLVGMTNIFQGKVSRHDTTRGVTWLDWNGLELECVLQQQFEVGSSVRWLIPQDRIILHQKVRPSRGQAENPVEGRIAEMTTMGGNVVVVMNASHCPEVAITFTLPSHVVERNRLNLQDLIGVSFKTDGVHILGD